MPFLATCHSCERCIVWFLFIFRWRIKFSLSLSQHISAISALDVSRRCALQIYILLTYLLTYRLLWRWRRSFRLDGCWQTHVVTLSSLSLLSAPRASWTRYSITRLNLLITSAKEVMFLPSCVCLSVGNSERRERILMKFFGRVGCEISNNWLGIRGEKMEKN